VVVRRDKRREPNETFQVNLIGATNATISDRQGIGTILNDDGPQGKSGTTSTRTP
jgi:serralysin